jgi:hypothetical protein
MARAKQEGSAQGCIELEIEVQKKWSKAYVQYVALLYCIANGSEHENGYKVDMLDKFITVLRNEIFQSTVGKIPSGSALLTKEIFPSRYSTLLEQICFSVYKKYIQDVSKTAELIISKKDLERLNQSPAKMMQYIRELAECTEKFLGIEGSLSGENIVLELTLLFH